MDIGRVACAAAAALAICAAAAGGAAAGSKSPWVPQTPTITIPTITPPLNLGGGCGMLKSCLPTVETLVIRPQQPQQGIRARPAIAVPRRKSR